MPDMALGAGALTVDVVGPLFTWPRAGDPVAPARAVSRGDRTSVSLNERRAGGGTGVRYECVPKSTV
jgi:hypothetical protein